MEPNTQPPNTEPTQGGEPYGERVAVPTTEVTPPKDSVSTVVRTLQSSCDRLVGELSQTAIEGQKAGKDEPGETAFSPCETKPAQAETTKPENEKGSESARDAENTASLEPNGGDPENAAHIVRELGVLAFGKPKGRGRGFSVKIKALELLAKYHGLIIERTQRVPADVREAQELLLVEARRAGVSIMPGPRPLQLVAGANQPSKKPRRQVVDVKAEEEDDPA